MRGIASQKAYERPNALGQDDIDTDYNPLVVGRVVVGRADYPGKRAFDIAFSIAALVFLAPLLLIIVALVRADGGPAFFAHNRIGRAGIPFRCLKLRTMVVNAETELERILAEDPAARAQWEARFKLDNDPRITRIGRFLRATSLDELPQFINVLRGDMSLVGPRPIVAAELARYGDAQPWYLAQRPGLTGLWQVSGRSDVSYPERVRLDLRYLSSMSLLQDLRIIFATAGIVFSRQGAR